MNILGKAILVIDMPERCSMCEFLKENGKEHYCSRLSNFDVVDDYMQSTTKGKPDWCPLKVLPDKREPRKIKDDVNLGHYYVSSFDKGYNKCIDDILNDKD